LSDDHLQRLLLEQANVRCVVAHVDDVYRTVLARGAYPDLLARTLGESLVVAALCSSGVKFEGRISLQLRASGPLKLLMADCTDAGGMRGLARFDADGLLGARDFTEMAQGGVLTMTVEPSGSGRMWQGIVPVEGAGMADAVAAYFDQSEQLPTRVVLAVTGQRAAGALVQRLPGEAADADGWNRVCKLLDTVGRDELLDTDAGTLMQRLFHEERRRLFPARPLHFHCPCSRERVARVLRGLGAGELDELVEAQGEVEVSCEFCNEQYRFDALDVQRVLHSELPEHDDGSGSVH
jgi:molecular chaperone Hsp33